jgi:hypothetical protein
LPVNENKETFKIKKFTATAGQVDFNLDSTFREDSCIVFLNGILQEVDVDYTETNLSQRVTFTQGLSAGDKVEVRYVNA